MLKLYSELTRVRNRRRRGEFGHPFNPVKRELNLMAQMNALAGERSSWRRYRNAVENWRHNRVPITTVWRLEKEHHNEMLRGLTLKSLAWNAAGLGLTPKQLSALSRVQGNLGRLYPTKTPSKSPKRAASAPLSRRRSPSRPPARARSL
jgi:hypothetical protein